MKHLPIILSISFLFPVSPISLAAQDTEEEMEEVEQEIEVEIEGLGQQMEDWGEAMEEWGEDLEEAIDSGETIPGVPSLPIFGETVKSGTKPKFDAYLEDMDFEEAYEKHYPYNYGVLITGVVYGGNAQNAGLIKGDIIMEFDGIKVLYEDHLIGLRNSKKIGDSVKLKIFRNETILEKTLTFAPPTPKEDEITLEKDSKKKKKKKLSVGYGGGGPAFYHIDFDFSGINNLLQLNGFGPLNDGYIVTVGGFGMGNMGKGWFVGGLGASYDLTEQLPIKDSLDITTAYRSYDFRSSFGGVTITKKLPFFSKNIILDLGMMLGHGETSIAINQTSGDFTWDEEIEGGENYSLHYKKSYLAYRPEVGLLVRIKSWVGIHGSVGYFGTYSKDDKWTEQNFDFTVSGNSPATPSGLSYSLGIWFGY